ncbi:MAG: hypothetical protein ACQERB_13500 [Promethearchaeati archaeon]
MNEDENNNGMNDSSKENIKEENIKNSEKREKTGIEELDNQNLRKFIKNKKMEEEISSGGYKLMEEASELAMSNAFDEAIKKYIQAKSKFKDLGWNYEIDLIQKTIEKLEIKKEKFLRRLEEKRKETEKKIELEKKQKEILEEGAKKKREAEELERTEKLKELKNQKEEEKSFQNEISSLVQRAERLVREYELNLKKEIKKGNFLEENPYPEVIDIYEQVYKKLLKKGWKTQAEIYSKQIKLYNEKLEKDKKLREIEDEKKQKQEQMEEFYKTGIKQEEREYEGRERLQKEKEEKEFEEEISNMTQNAERLAREYEINLKKELKEGNFPETNPYLEVIDIYEQVYKKLLKKGWKTQAEIYSKQIKLYNEKLEKDKKLREIEDEKKQKQEQMEEFYKTGIKQEEREYEGRERLQKEKEEKEFEEEISNMTQNAERLAREYEINLKKELKEGNFPETNPYLEVIDIYEQVYKKLMKKGWKGQAEIYSKQIKLYNEKLEKDRKLREIEDEKKQKQEQMEEFYKTGIKQEYRENEGRERLQKEKEEKELQEEISNMVEKAEKMSREYESKRKKMLKDGKFPEENPYREIIEIYEKVRKALHEKGWENQAAIYKNQIKIYQDKLEKDKKLRTIEESKVKKQQKIEEFHKTRPIKEKDDQDLINIETQIKKEIEEKKFEEKIDQMVEEAERLSREYEVNLMRGNFDQECPYPEIIEIYRNLRSQLQERGWNEEASLYANQIQLYKEKLEKDKRLRRIESSKTGDYDLVSEVKKSSKRDKISKIPEDLRKKEEEQEFQEEITERVNQAEKIAREYENELKKGDFEIVNKYPEVIKIYRKIRKDLLDRGWFNEAEIYLNQINIYKKKAKKVENLKTIEKQKAERDKKIEEMHKLQKPIEKPAKKIDETERKEKEDRQEKLNKAMELIDEAEQLVKAYELKLKPRLLDFESPYQKAINMYQDAKDLLSEIGWENEAIRLYETIDFYKEKREKDERLRELEKQKVKAGEVSSPIELTMKDIEGETEKAYAEVQREREREKNIYDEIFQIVTNAENLAKDYQKKIDKDGILNHEAPYEKVIELYKEAKEKFQNVGWLREAEKLNESIKYYKKKLEDDNRLKELERQRVKRQEQELLAQQKLMEKSKEEEQKILQEQEKTILKEREAKKRYEKQKEQAFKIIDKALEIAKEYNKKIQKENILDIDCPYEEVIRLYKEASKIFKEIGWENEADKMIQSINYYNQKLVEDKKLRFTEQERIKREKEEILEQQQLIKQSKEEEQKLLEEQEKILEKERERKEIFEKQKDHAFGLMEKAKKELTRNNFEEAITLYKECKEIFKNIEWDTGIDLVEESINSILREKRKYEKEQKFIEEKKEEEEKFKRELEERIEKMHTLKNLEEEEKRKEILRVQEEKRKEKAITDEAFKLLEEGTELVDIGEFDRAYQKYIKARDLFMQVNWDIEVSRINNELLYNLERERANTERIQESQKKKRAEERELMELIKKKEKMDEEQKRKEIEEKRRRLVERKRAEKPKEEVMDKLELAKVLINNYKYNEALVKLLEKKKEVSDKDSEKQIQNVIEKIKEESNLPLIVLMAPHMTEDNRFIVGYEALDKAERSIINKNYMKAISELNESKFNLDSLNVDKEIISSLEDKISFYKKEMGYEIAESVKHEEKLEDLKSEIAKRRAERRNRLKRFDK